jgi:hypothetical protein
VALTKVDEVRGPSSRQPKAKMKIKNISPPGSGPQSAQNPKPPKENDSPNPPPDPRGRGASIKIKSSHKNSWDEAATRLQKEEPTAMRSIAGSGVHLGPRHTRPWVTAWWRCRWDPGHNPGVMVHQGFKNFRILGPPGATETRAYGRSLH